MKSKAIYITNENFEYCVYKFHPYFNFSNKLYLDRIREEYFELVHGKELPIFTARDYLRDVLKRHGFEKEYKNKISHWNSLGYTDINMMIAVIYQTYKNMPTSERIIFCNDDEKFKEFIERSITDFNFENLEFYNKIKHDMFNGLVFIFDTSGKKKLLSLIYEDKKPAGAIVSERYWIVRGFTEDYAKKKVSEIQRPRSKRCKEYYINKGFDEESAIREVSNTQKQLFYKSKGNIEYWKMLGFSDKDAIEMSGRYLSMWSVWAKEHWLLLGFTEKEAEEKVLEYNPSSPKFKNYNNDSVLYAQSIQRASERAKKRWMGKQYRDKKILAVKAGKIASRAISKSEIKMFDILRSNVDKNIKHESYLVIIPDEIVDSINTYFYMCDGYLVTETNNVIIFEFDGILYHNEDKDQKRDKDIFMIDDRVIGIIRISESFFNNNAIPLDEKIKMIKDGIQKIKNSTEVRIKF